MTAAKQARTPTQRMIRAAKALDRTHGFGKLGVHTPNVRDRVAASLDGIGKLQTRDIKYLEMIARGC